MADQRSGNERPLEGLTILIVEDQFLIALDMETMVRDAGGEVLGPCATLPIACAAASQEQVSAAVLDFRLGEDTTADVARILTARSIPFLFYTGQHLPQDAPAVPVVAKPANRRALVEAIGALVRRSD